MPKVKFSALVSDMKGKANGSVFASNSGGTYFRTNKTGGGQKSISWATNKNSFADISGTWRSLTDEEKTAWKDARTLYPTKNAFGDVRLPSAYELYMRLNGVLSAASLPILTTPLTPRTMPQMTNVSVIIPEEEVFTPTNITRIPLLAGKQTRLQMKIDEADYDPFELNSFSCRFVIPSNFKNYWVVGKIYQLFNAMYDLETGTTVFMRINNDNTASFFLATPFATDTGGKRTYIAEYIVPRDYINTQIQLVVQVYGFDQSFNKLWVNGIEFNTALDGFVVGHFADPTLVIDESANVQQNYPATGSIDTADLLIILGSTQNIYYAPFQVSDFRAYWNQEIETPCSNNNPCDEGYQCVQGVCSARNTYRAPAGSTDECYDPYVECPPDMQCIDGTCVAYGDEDLYNSPANVLKLEKGYIIGKETIAVGFETSAYGVPAPSLQPPVLFPNVASGLSYAAFVITATQLADPCADCVGNDFECQDGVCVYVGDRLSVLQRNTITYGPLATFRANGIETENFYVQVYFSKLISAGRSIEQVPYVLLGTFKICACSSDLSQKMLELVGNYPDGSTFAFKANILDGTTGMVYDTQIPLAKPYKNVSKFKGSAILSGKVN